MCKSLGQKDLFYNRIAYLSKHNYPNEDKEVAIQHKDSVDGVEPSSEGIEHIQNEMQGNIQIIVCFE